MPSTVFLNFTTIDILLVKLQSIL